MLGSARLRFVIKEDKASNTSSYGVTEAFWEPFATYKKSHGFQILFLYKAIYYVCVYQIEIEIEIEIESVVNTLVHCGFYLLKPEFNREWVSCELRAEFNVKSGLYIVWAEDSYENEIGFGGSKRLSREWVKRTRTTALVGNLYVFEYFNFPLIFIHFYPFLANSSTASFKTLNSRSFGG